MVSAKKLKANRRNSKLSTGPKDTSETRYNAVKHGITSKQVVVPQVDGPDAADRYDEIRTSLRQYFSPEGPLEEAFVDQIALGLHQQRRLLAYENAVISDQADSFLDRRNFPVREQRIIIESIEIQVALTSLEEQGELRDVTDATYLERFIRERLGKSDDRPMGEPKGTRIEGGQQFDSYTREQLQQLINFACDQGKCSEESLRTQVKDFLKELVLQAEQALEAITQEIEYCRGRASLPDDMELNRILKYDTHICNRIHKCLRELQRLQAHRISGQPVATAAVDVTLTVDSPIFDDAYQGVSQSQESPATSASAQPAGLNTANERSPVGESIINRGEHTDSDEPVPVVPEPVRLNLEKPPIKGLKLRDYLGQDEVARLVNQLGDEHKGAKDTSEALHNGAANQ